MQLNEETLKQIIQTYTDTEVNDPIADRDALEAIVAVVLYGDYYGDHDVKACGMINAWRKEQAEINRKEEQEYNEEVPF